MPVGMGGEQLADLAQFRGPPPPSLNDFVFPHRHWIYRKEGSEFRQKCKNLWAARSLELVPTPTSSRALWPLSQNENCWAHVWLGWPGKHSNRSVRCDSRSFYMNVVMNGLAKEGWGFAGMGPLSGSDLAEVFRFQTRAEGLVRTHSGISLVERV